MIEMFEDLKRLEIRTKEVTREIKALAAKDDWVRRRMTVPGIGPLGATALLASAGSGPPVREGSRYGCWLGLVPRQQSTAGRPPF